MVVLLLSLLANTDNFIIHNQKTKTMADTKVFSFPENNGGNDGLFGGGWRSGGLASAPFL